MIKNKTCEQEISKMEDGSLMEHLGSLSIWYVIFYMSVEGENMMT